jgi:tRNA U34 5-carboxymethylaminomethyl modifying GTPase MnmE/TrmE
MRESTQQQIEIHDTSSFGFNKLIEYLYTQQLPIDKNEIKEVDEKVVEMLIVSDKFGCDELKEQLEIWIGRHLTIENVSSLFVVSDRCNSLKKQCHKFIQQNYEKVKQTSEYQELAEEMEKLIK